MRPVLDSSSFARVLTLPRRTILHSASIVLAIRISCRVIAVFVFRNPLFINSTLTYLCFLHECYVYTYSFRYYPRFHVTAVGLGTYYPWIWVAPVLSFGKSGNNAWYWDERVTQNALGMIRAWSSEGNSYLVDTLLVDYAKVWRSFQPHEFYFTDMKDPFKFM
jgi:hypothetical protein